MAWHPIETAPADGSTILVGTDKWMAVAIELDVLSLAVQKACAQIDRLQAEKAELLDALKAITKACVDDCASVDTDWFPDQESVGGGLEGECALTFGMIRRARSAIAKAERR